jgi:hypothetical protein
VNKNDIIRLLEDGAEFHWLEAKLVHPSFRKGWRKMKISNISWQAVDREHGIWGSKRLTETNNIIRLI